MKYRIAVLLGLFWGAVVSLHADPDTLYICPGDAVRLEAPEGFNYYYWQAAPGLTNSVGQKQVVKPAVSTLYVVDIYNVRDTNELVVNGDFSRGNFGFSSQYIYTPGATFLQGRYGIMNTPKQFNNGFSGCHDHSPTPDNLMMVIDGAIVLNEKVWCSKVAVEPNTNYAFSTWITSVEPRAPARLQFTINDVQIGDPFQATSLTCEWNEFYEVWNSGNAREATICVTNQNTEPLGNDFALDDFSFRPIVSTRSDSFYVVVREVPRTRIDTSICEKSTFIYNGQVYPPNTRRSFTFTAATGCDSIVDLQVGLTDTILTSIRVDTLCPGESLVFFGETILRDTTICRTYSPLNSCDSTVCVTVYFLSEATIDIDTIPPSCAGLSDGALLATPFAGLPPYQFSWSNGAASAGIDRLQAGNYTLTVTDAKNCRAVKPIRLPEPERLGQTLVANPVSCYDGADGSLISIAGGGTPPYEYRLNGGDWNGSPTRQNLRPGRYAMSLQDGNGCLRTDSATVTAPSPVSVVLNADTNVVILGQVLPVSATSSGDFPFRLEWPAIQDPDCPDCSLVNLYPFESGLIKVIATDSMGCIASDSLFVTVEKNYGLYAPNAFSPNEDGFNDRFNVYAGANVQEVNALYIFDRWGNILFKTNNCPVGDESCGWDGTVNGAPLDAAVYVFYVEVTYIDGVTGTVSGEVVLLR